MIGRAAPEFPVERRREEREASSDALILVTQGGHAFDATAVDRSLSGLRVRSTHVAALPTLLTVLVPTAGLAHQAELVWRTPPYAGLRLLRTTEMRTATGPDDAELRRIWRQHVGR